MFTLTLKENNSKKLKFLTAILYFFIMKGVLYMKFKIKGKFLKLEEKIITKEDSAKKGEHYFLVRFLIDFDIFDFYIFNVNECFSKLNKLQSGTDYSIELNLYKRNNITSLDLLKIEV